MTRGYGVTGGGGRGTMTHGIHMYFTPLFDFLVRGCFECTSVTESACLQDFRLLLKPEIIEVGLQDFMISVKSESKPIFMFSRVEDRPGEVVGAVADDVEPLPSGNLKLFPNPRIC